MGEKLNKLKKNLENLNSEIHGVDKTNPEKNGGNAAGLENTDVEKMDPLMLAIKRVRSIGNHENSSDGELSLEDLNKQRAAQERLALLATPGIGVAYEQNKVDEIPIEWARPEFAHVKKPMILYCHGGGYTCGGLGYAGILSGKMAMHTGYEVLTFQYRLSPENPYPAAIEDAIRIWDYLMYLGYGADDVILAGDSAGGNLALELVLELKKNKRMLPKGMILMSPWTDMTITSSAYEKYKDVDPMLTKEYVLTVRGAYAGKDADFAAPELSPLFADLSDFPTTYIQVGSNEILRGDSEKLYKKLKQADVKTKLTIYKGGWHVFQQLPIHRATVALEDIATFVQSI